MRVLLLNPPGRSRYIRDNYCSKTAKAAYGYSPVDLLLQSGRFDDVHLIDAIQAGWSVARTHARIDEIRPQAVISLVGAVSWQEDRAFLADVKQRDPARRIFVSGDVVLGADPGFLDAHPWLTGILLDYTTDDTRRALAGDYDRIEQMIVRNGDGRIVAPSRPRARGEIADLPMPRHDLFLPLGYRFPFVRSARFATVQTDYGCPFLCRFCTMGPLGYKTRPVERVLEELACLRERGVREIYFNDQTFGAAPGRMEALCDGMLRDRLGMGWCAWARADAAAPHLERIRRAGGHTLMFGIESANEETLQRQRKGFSVDQARSTIGRCRKLGIRTLTTFIIGLPGETREQAGRTVDLALELDADFASFNVFVPRPTTDARRRLEADGLAPPAEATLDQSGLAAQVACGPMTAADIRELRSAAVRRFYLRMPYVFRRLRDVRTAYDLGNLVRMAASMAAA